MINDTLYSLQYIGFRVVLLLPQRKEEVVMTDKQRELIYALREKGMGYTSIGKEIGLSRDVVRNFCKSRGLAGYAGNNPNYKGKRMYLKYKDGKCCRLCGREISQPKTGRPRRFCGESCRRQWWKIHPELGKKQETAMYIFSCKHCGKEFAAYGNQKRKYCSHQCYIRERFWTPEEEAEWYGTARNDR